MDFTRSFCSFEGESSIFVPYECPRVVSPSHTGAHNHRRNSYTERVLLSHIVHLIPIDANDTLFSRPMTVHLRAVGTDDKKQRRQRHGTRDADEGVCTYTRHDDDVSSNAGLTIP